MLEIRLIYSKHLGLCLSLLSCDDYLKAAASGDFLYSCEIEVIHLWWNESPRRVFMKVILQFSQTVMLIKSLQSKQFVLELE